MSEAVIQLEHVDFAYGDHPVLEDVSLLVERGEFLGLIGPNGSGKTTLLRILLGLERPERGRVRLFGQGLDRFREWRRIGYVPQKAAAFNSSFPATVAEVVATGRVAARGWLRPLGRRDRDAVRRALEVAGIAELAGKRIGELSGGQQQRAFIARALASRPELLILDEPTVGVDAPAQEAFYALLRRLRQEMALTIVYVSHDIGFVTQEVTRLACLNRRLHFHGTPEQCHLESLNELYGHPVALVTHRH